MPPTKKPPDKLWYPTLLQVANNIQTNSWFDMNEKINSNPNSKLTSLRQDKDINYLKTMKILIYLVTNFNVCVNYVLFFM